MTVTSTKTVRKPLSALRELLESEASGGLVLMASAAAALAVANSSWAPVYREVFHAKVGGLSVLHWINDGLMVLFFVLVGLEIKRELLDGQLRTWPDRVLPGLAAAGGMAIPAAVYAAVNWTSPETLRGWAVPAATDIAFALGILALLRSHAPVSLKVFLTALAIIDDLGAILIIAVFYTADLSWPMLAGAGATFAVLVGLNRFGVARLLPYCLLGLLLWFFVLKSGVHATVAGVLLATTIPLKLSPGRPDDPGSPLHRLEHKVHPWSSYLVLPIFGFANAGVALSGMGPDKLLAPVTLGVALGLFVGKQFGVFGVALATVKLGLAGKPAHASWAQIYGVSLLCGIGFTMSLFIGSLAFQEGSALEDQVKVGVLAGSILCMLLGALTLRFGPKERN